jgi:hypothetical protein
MRATIDGIKPCESHERRDALGGVRLACSLRSHAERSMPRHGGIETKARRCYVRHEHTMSLHSSFLLTVISPVVSLHPGAVA